MNCNSYPMKRLEKIRKKIDQVKSNLGRVTGMLWIPSQGGHEGQGVGFRDPRGELNMSPLSLVARGASCLPHSWKNEYMKGWLVVQERKGSMLESACIASFLSLMIWEFPRNQKQALLQRQRAELGFVVGTVWEGSANRAKKDFSRKKLKVYPTVPRSPRGS